MLYCSNCASVGVPLKASNKSHKVTPGSASIWFRSVVGGPPMSAYAISTRNALGVPEREAVCVPVGVDVAVGVRVAVGVAVGVAVRVALGDAVGVAVGVGVGPQG